MLEPTNANRALVNRGIAESQKYLFHLADYRCGRIYVYKTATADAPTILDYTRDLNACYEVCEERGWKIQSNWMYYDDGDMYSVSVIHPKAGFWNAFTGTDLRWLVAQAVWQAVKAQGNGSD